MRVLDLYIYKNKGHGEKLVDYVLKPMQIAFNGRKITFNGPNGGDVIENRTTPVALRIFAGFSCLLLSIVIIPASLIKRFYFEDKSINKSRTLPNQLNDRTDRSINLGKVPCKRNILTILSENHLSCVYPYLSLKDRCHLAEASCFFQNKYCTGEYENLASLFKKYINLLPSECHALSTKEKIEKIKTILLRLPLINNTHKYIWDKWLAYDSELKQILEDMQFLIKKQVIVYYTPHMGGDFWYAELIDGKITVTTWGIYHDNFDTDFKTLIDRENTVLYNLDSTHIDRENTVLYNLDSTHIESSSLGDPSCMRPSKETNIEDFFAVLQTSPPLHPNSVDANN